MRSKSTGAHGAGRKAGRDPVPTSRTGIANEPAPDPGAHGPASRVLDLLVLALSVVYLVLLWRQAAPARFASDECFHAHVATWIAAHGRLPQVLPEFYTGLPYFYPPLFHIVGAIALQLAGPASFRYLNVILTGGLVATLYALPVPGFSRIARRCAILLCIANSALSLYAVRFYAETLAATLAVLVVLLLLRARALPGRREGILLGLAVGAALLAKQPAAVFPLLLAVIAAVDLARGRRTLAGTMLIALGVSLALAGPWFVRNALLFGSPFYPPVTNPAQIALDAMNTRRFSLPAPMFHRNALTVLGPIIPWLAIAALVWNVVRGRFQLVTGLLAGSLAFCLLAPWVPRFQPRHLNPVTAMLAVLASIVLAEALGRWRRVLPAAQAALLAATALYLPRLTGLRAGLDAAPGDLEAYRAIAEHVPPGGVVLSRLTYDTWYYARRSATWPIPWSGSAAQLELFGEPDPGRFLAQMDRLGIGNLLLPRRATALRFHGTNHPQSMIACAAALVDRGQLRVLWSSADQVLVGRIK